MKWLLCVFLLVLFVGIGLTENPIKISICRLSSHGQASKIKAEDVSENITTHSEPSLEEDIENKNSPFFKSTIIISTFILFIILLFIPFGPGIIELLKPKDSAPLYIDMNYVKDPNYFAQSARAILKNGLMKPHLPQGMGEIELSKKESIELIGSKRIPSREQIDHVLYVKGNLDSGREVKFAKEVFVNGNVSIGENNVLRAVDCVGDIFLSRATRIRRWIRSEGNIETQEGCDLGISASCKGKFNIAKNCTFKSLYGNPINISSGVTGRETSDFSAVKPFNKKIKIGDVSWLIVRKHISVNQRLENKDENIILGKSNLLSKSKSNEDQKWFITSKYISIPSVTPVKRNFVARKSLIVSQNCTMLGSIKAYEDVIIENNVTIYGNIFAEGNISIGNNCMLLGNVFSQGRISISSGTTIGKARDIKSVIGKKGIELSKNITIHGYALTEGSGAIL